MGCDKFCQWGILLPHPGGGFSGCEKNDFDTVIRDPGCEIRAAGYQIPDVKSSISSYPGGIFQVVVINLFEFNTFLTRIFYILKT
jgi:hypothetical protein